VIPDSTAKPSFVIAATPDVLAEPVKAALNANPQ